MTVADRISPLLNGTYTITNKSTGEYRTVMVKTQKARASFMPGKRVLSLLVGSNNESDYYRIGTVSDRGVLIFRNCRAARGEKATVYEYCAAMLWDLAVEDGARFGARYDLLASNTCIRCNRKLTTPESIRAGIGPECARRR